MAACSSKTYDLVPSERPARNTYCDTNIDAVLDKPDEHTSIEIIRTQNEKPFDQTVSSVTCFAPVENTAKATRIDQSNMFVLEHQTDFLVSCGQISNQLEAVVDNLFDTLTSDIFSTHTVPQTECIQPTERDREHQQTKSNASLDLKPSTRCAASRILEQGNVLACSGNSVSDSVCEQHVRLDQTSNETISEYHDWHAQHMSQIQPVTYTKSDYTCNVPPESLTSKSLKRKRVSLPLECSPAATVISGMKSIACAGNVLENFSPCDAIKSSLGSSDRRLENQSKRVSLPLECSPSVTFNGRLTSEVCVENSENSISDLRCDPDSVRNNFHTAEGRAEIESSQSNCGNDRDGTKPRLKRKEYFSDSAKNSVSSCSNKKKVKMDINSGPKSLKSKTAHEQNKRCGMFVSPKLISKKYRNSKQKIINKSRKSKLFLNTPSKSFHVIQNVHEKLAKTGEFKMSDFASIAEGEDMMSKLHDIFPLESMNQKPLRPLRSSTVKENHTLHRKYTAVGIWNSVNSTY